MIMVVCGNCGKSLRDDECSIELNFRDSVLYYYCKNCKKENKIELKDNNSSIPLARPRTMKRK